MLFVQLQVILVTLLAFACLGGFRDVAARPTRGTILNRQLTVEERALTNAQRLARGLPPGSPVIKRFVPGVGEASSRTLAAKRAGSSGLPIVYSGRIEVRDAGTGNSYGFIRNQLGGPSQLDLGGTFGGDIVFEITTSSGNNGPLDIRALAPLWSGSPYIGGAYPGTLSVGSAISVPFDDTPQTSPGALPGPNGASAIWFYNPQTSEITAQWINPDGSTPDTIIGFDTRVNRLFFVGDVAEYNSHTTYSTTAVNFFLVP